MPRSPSISRREGAAAAGVVTLLMHRPLVAGFGSTLAKDLGRVPADLVVYDLRPRRA